MEGTYTGLGVAFGAGLGMIIGLLFLETWWVAMAIGAVTGLVLGSVAENTLRNGGSGGGG